VFDSLTGLKLAKDALQAIIDVVSPYIDSHAKTVDPKNPRDFLDLMLCEQLANKVSILRISFLEPIQRLRVTAPRVA
jgi:hypothetical protein